MYAHITWHTWRRVGCIDARAAREVRIAVASAGKQTGLQVIKGEVLANHVHLLVSFRPDTRLSDFMRLAKSVAATRANRVVMGSVRWARGYYVATIHKNDLPRVLRYIDQQFQRHPDLIPRPPRFSDPGRKPGVNEQGIWLDLTDTSHQPLNRPC
jgi:REP element-mobilizing transposase RayT